MMRLTTKFAAGALGLAMGAALVCWPAPVRAEEDVPLDTRVIRGIMEGIGLRKDGDQIISYPERAPLVIPSAKVLPPPEKSDAVIANNPAWPKDPEVTRRKKEAERERNRNVSDERERESRPLSPGELTPGAGTSRDARRVDPDSYKGETNGGGNPLPPSELGSKGGIFGSLFKKDDGGESAKFTGEPPRASLTAPPRGYQTPSPDQPYGVGKEAAAKPKSDYETRGTIEDRR
jgi:hypothetical protein